MARNRFQQSFFVDDMVIFGESHEELERLQDVVSMEERKGCPLMRRKARF